LNTRKKIALNEDACGFVRTLLLKLSLLEGGRMKPFVTKGLKRIALRPGVRKLRNNWFNFTS
jgi:hypothetical protein